MYPFPLCACVGATVALSQERETLQFQIISNPECRYGDIVNAELGMQDSTPGFLATWP